MDGLYLLRDDGHTPYAVSDLLAWADGIKTQRRTRLTRVGIPYTGYRYGISTVFLGMDFNFARFLDEREPPILWETKIVYEPHMEEWWRRARRIRSFLRTSDYRMPHDPLHLHGNEWRYTSHADAIADHELRVEVVMIAIDAFRRRPHARARILPRIIP